MVDNAITSSALGFILPPMMLGYAGYLGWRGWKAIASTSRGFKVFYLAALGVIALMVAAPLSYIAYLIVANKPAG